MTSEPAVAADEVGVFVDPSTYVAVVELRRPPENFLDLALLQQLTQAMARLDDDPQCRAIVLAADGKHFCAGRDFRKPRAAGDDSEVVYATAAELVGLATPIVAAVQGAAIGAGLGLAACADFRFCSPRAYFSANFVTLGLHHGFGLTATLPSIVGEQRCRELLYLGRRIGSDEALRIDLVDKIVDEDGLRAAAVGFATELAALPPLALRSIRATLRAGLAERFRVATTHESEEQAKLRTTWDFTEAAAATRERRPGQFRAE